MIRQDYLIRMIQEMISLVLNAMLNKKKLKKDEWKEYDYLSKQILGYSPEQLMNMNTDELIDSYKDDQDKIQKIELAAMTMLMLAEDMELDLLQKSKLRQDGITLLQYVDKEDNSFSLQRKQLLEMLEMDSPSSNTIFP